MSGVYQHLVIFCYLFILIPVILFIYIARFIFFYYQIYPKYYHILPAIFIRIKTNPYHYTILIDHQQHIYIFFLFYPYFFIIISKFNMNTYHKIVAYAKIGKHHTQHKKLHPQTSTYSTQLQPKQKSIYDQIINQMSQDENQYIKSLLNTNQTKSYSQNKNHLRSNSQNHLFTLSEGFKKNRREESKQRLSDVENKKSGYVQQRIELRSMDDRKNMEVVKRKYEAEIDRICRNQSEQQIEEQDFVVNLDNYIDRLDRNMKQKKEKKIVIKMNEDKRNCQIISRILNKYQQNVENLEYNLQQEINKLKRKQQKTQHQYKQVLQYLHCLQKNYQHSKKQNQKLTKILHKIQIHQFQNTHYTPNYHSDVPHSYSKNHHFL